MSSSLHFAVLSSISIAAAVSAFTFLSKTNFYNTHFGNSFLWLFPSAFIALHFILLLFHSRLRKPKLLNGGFGKYIATPVLFFATCSFFHFTPDKSPTGLLFVMSLWVDVIAIVQIIRPLTEPKLQIQLMMAIISRSMDLYSFFTGTYWLIMLFCTIVLYATNIYKDRVAVSSQIMEGDTKKKA